MKPVVSLLLILASLILMWTCAAVRLTEPKAAAPISITPELIERIEIGMTPAQVKSILGQPTNIEPHGGAELYWWADSDHEVSTRFVDGKLTHKTAVGFD